MEYTGKFEAGQWVYVAEDVSQSLPLNSRSQHAEVRSKQGKRLKVQFWPRALFPVIDLQKDAIVSLTFFWLKQISFLARSISASQSLPKACLHYYER